MLIDVISLTSGMLAAPFLWLGVVEGGWQSRIHATGISRDISIRSADKAIGAMLPLYVYEKTYLRPIVERERERVRARGLIALPHSV